MIGHRVKDPKNKENYLKENKEHIIPKEDEHFIQIREETASPQDILELHDPEATFFYLHEDENEETFSTTYNTSTDVKEITISRIVEKEQEKLVPKKH